MAKRSVPKAPASGLYQKEYQALETAYALLLSGAGMLRTAEAAIESTSRDTATPAISLAWDGILETVQAAHGRLTDANNALADHFGSPLYEKIEAIRQPLWDVLDLVYVALFAINAGDAGDFPCERPSSDHPEAALLRVAATMAAGRGLQSVAAAVAQLQEKIRTQREGVAQ